MRRTGEADVRARRRLLQLGAEPLRARRPVGGGAHRRFRISVSIMRVFASASRAAEGDVPYARVAVGKSQGIGDMLCQVMRPASMITLFPRRTKPVNAHA